MKKRIMALALAAAMGFSLFAACGGTGGQGADPEPAASGTGEQQVLEVALFEGGLGAEFWREIIARFEEEHPDIKVEATINPKVGEIIRPRIVAGDPPDFIDLSDTDASGVLTAMIKDRQLTDLSDVFEGPAYDQDMPLKDLIAEGFLTGRKFAPYGDGKTYIAPKYCGPIGLVYDAALFEEKGWQPPVTWDELFALGDKAKAEGIALLTFPGIYPYYLEHFILSSLASSVGMNGMNDIFAYKEGSFSTPEVMAVLQQLQKLGEGGYLLEGSAALNHTQSQTEMMLGNALFVPTGAWVEGEMEGAPRREGFTFGMCTGPVMSAADEKYIYSNYGQLFIPKDAKNPEAAKEFLRFYYTEASAISLAKYGNAVMPLKDGKEVVKEYISETQYNMFDLFNQGTAIMPDYEALPVGSKIDVYELFYSKGVAQLLYGEMTAAECAEAVEKGFAQINAERAAEG